MLSELWYRLRAVVRRSEMERELEEELRAHAEHAAARGLESREDVERVKEACREARGVWWWETLRQDGRYAWRQMRRRPALAASAVVALALGTGLNLALFRVVWGVLLKPLPYWHAEQLVELSDVDDNGREARKPKRESLNRWRESATTLSEVAGYRGWMVTATGPVEPERVRAAVVTWQFFPLLRVAPWQGRLFQAEDDRLGAPDAVMVSYRYWVDHFQGRMLRADDTIEADGRLCRIIGVLPADYHGTLITPRREPEIYLSFKWLWEGDEDYQSMTGIGRLRAGATVESARTELNALSKEAGAPKRQRNGARVEALAVESAKKMTEMLMTLFGLTLCVLLIACFSVSNLLLAQALARRQEFAIRAALGAGRRRLLRQLGVEALLLAGMGTALGLAAGWGLLKGLGALEPYPMPRLAEGGGVEAMGVFAVVLAGLAAACTGLLPAWLATKGAVADDLRAMHAALGRRQGRWMRLLVGAQLAFTLMVLVSAGLLLKSFVALRAVDPGFVKENVLTTQIMLPDVAYQGPEAHTRFVERLVQRMAAMPGVEAAGLTCSMPLRYNFNLRANVTVPGTGEERPMLARTVAGDYFGAMRMRMVAGRRLTEADARSGQNVVVNEAFVQRYLHGRMAVGEPLSMGGRIMTVAGVVANVRGEGIDKAAEPELYLPFRMLPYPYLDIALRSHMAAGELTARLRREVAEMDPKLALNATRTLEEVVEEDLAGAKLQAVLVGLFALVALALATVGVYGVVAQSVRARTAEIGVRLALGATRGRVAGSVLRDGLVAPVLGLAAGLVGAWVASRHLASLLYSVEPRDGAVFAVCAGVLVLVSLLSCALPARSAARLDPVRVLREE